MHLALFFSHWHEEVLVHAARQLEVYITLAATNHDMLKPLLNGIEVLVANDLTCLVTKDMVVAELVVRRERELVS